MKTVLQLPIAVLFLLLSWCSFAQTILFKSDSLTVDSAQYVEIGIRVDSFTKVSSAQFSVQWDPGVVQFSSIEKMSTALNLSASNFNSQLAPSGKLGFLWVDLSGIGVSLSSPSLLFVLRFKAIGKRGSKTSVNLNNEPVPIAIESFNGNLNYKVIPGQIRIKTLVGVTTVDLSSLISVAPNPANQNVYLSAKNAITGNWTIQIISGSGQIMATKVTLLNASPIDFATYDLASGYYWIRGFNQNFVFFKPLLIEH